MWVSQGYRLWFIPVQNTLDLRFVVNGGKVSLPKTPQYCYYMRMYADNKPFDAESLSVAAEILRMLADPTRIAIIVALDTHGKLAVGALATLLNKKPAGMSQHLAKLRMSRMVTTRHQGTSVLYSLTDEHAISLVTEAISQAEHALAHPPLPPHHHH